MITAQRISLALAIYFVATLSNAASPSEEWKSTIELGFVTTSGNTETETLNVKAGTATNRTKWRHKLSVTVLRASDASQTTAEKYTLSGKSDYKLTDPAYLFVTLNYEDDKFSGYDYQATEAVGYGWRIIEDLIWKQALARARAVSTMARTIRRDCCAWRQPSTGGSATAARLVKH